MKVLIAVLCVVSYAAGEPPAPYAPSGWRPSGPSFELPTEGQNPNYLPPVDPRIPASAPDAEDDVSVQGLPPRQEQRPIFQPSPIGGQQYVGPSFTRDIKTLDQGLKQSQFQIQQQKAREFARQKQENQPNRQPSINIPRFARPTVNPTEPSPRPDFKTTPFPSTESDLNEGETDDDAVSPAVADKQKVSVEVTRQKIQEYPPELFLNPLAQLRLQPVQFGQLKSPFIVGAEPSQKQIGFDAATHFAALPSVLAQEQLAKQQALLQTQLPQSQAYVIRGQTSGAGFVIQNPQLQPFVNGQYAPLVQAVAPVQGQNVVLQPQGANQIQPNPFPQPEEDERDDEAGEQSDNVQPQVSYQPQPAYQPQPQPQLIYQPQPQAAYQPEAQAFQPQVSYQPQQMVYQTEYQQPQTAFQQTYQPQPQYQVQAQTHQPQPQYQVQTQTYQPQAEGVFPQPQAFQPQADQPQLIYQQFPQAQDQNFAKGQLVNLQGQNLDQYYQQRLAEAQIQQKQGQDALQSGFNVNQQGNSVEDEDKDENEDASEDGGATATAVATAFGARTQPRVYTRYGAPVPRAQTATTESAVQDNTTEDAPAIAEATAVAGGRKKSAKLRNRRVRPVFTLDRSGHLVLAQDQQ